MKPMWRALGWRATALLGLALLAGAARAQPVPEARPEVLTWLVRDVPPYFSYPGGKAPQRPEDLANGEIDGFLRQLIKQLPQYRHEFLDAGFPRFEALVHQGQALCSPLHVVTPERLEWLYFTHVHPPLLSRQVHLIVRRESLAKFESFGAVPALAEVLQRNDLIGLLPRDRSFGVKIDPLLKERGDLAPKTIVTGRNMHLLAMLGAGRMDYTLEYPSTVDEYLRSTGSKQDFVKLPVAESRSANQATFACSRNPQGRKLIEAIDQAVRKLAQDPQREAWIRAWRGEQDAQERLRLKRYMDERAKGGAQIE
ncbi:TIGR02285 family protein [Roseateles oligotrophus]|uniref:TIGR02285 family protein n=1 Tax=Roseateles oligotrophus TaxID=1769250 RepID=A0ABT2YKX7_9BURK|nr:TIGR02285 family protein [Roseateles oligotrophus]MCV2370714.1 TIGR02285 family protein [Roseateles oligotrophus]